MPSTPPAVMESLGIQPRRNPNARRALIVLAAVGVGIVAGVCGYTVGTLDHRARVKKFAETATSALKARTPGEFRSILGDMEKQRAAVAQNPFVRFIMGRTYILAADRLPEQRINYEQALSEIKAAAYLTPREEIYSVNPFEISDAKSQILVELGRYEEALAETDRMQGIVKNMAKDKFADFIMRQLIISSWRFSMLLEKNGNGKKLSDPNFRRDMLNWLQVNFDNSRAYLLAVADDPKVKDPATALDLAKEVIKNPLPLLDGGFASGMPALVDTLAEAYYANGDKEKAVNAQTTALALATTDSLAIYLQHYDKYSADE
ncbi:MAG: hypothetical protein JXR97_09005 [Planctomycetes bacterium]|nr:hypothetical protein [Planctomycetota bacterium]